MSGAFSSRANHMHGQQVISISSPHPIEILRQYDDLTRTRVPGAMHVISDEQMASRPFHLPFLSPARTATWPARADIIRAAAHVPLVPSSAVRRGRLPLPKTANREAARLLRNYTYMPYSYTEEIPVPGPHAHAYSETALYAPCISWSA
jgi:hypothetical protein